ncbi:AfsR/SARP family transcriptional regulator [Streptomyces sp. NPDC052051]|uniref:AfsR/SARP family transcriptional regulator n=1 Tax=Streptomyces sp. NPDC052051 TaxID=3154649 RepID=UPI0034469EEA
MNVTPTAPKVRQVLALLALRANTTVSPHLLMEELWEEHPPSSAATTLQTYIYQLRKLPGLCPQPQGGSPGSGALLTTPGGYRLIVPTESLDAQRFCELATLGRQAMERGAVAESADLLKRALAVWRGPALDDLSPGPVTGIDVLRLQEQRYEALEGRIDADLQMGRHHQLISELTALTADNPTRESLHTKLMLCLYRAGRRSDALDVFQRIRETLVRELGLEPCSSLQRLHQNVLAGDATLDLPGGQSLVSGTSPSTPPVVMPAATPLTGRDLELQRAERLLCDGKRTGNAPRCVAVAGPPGAGATTFAVHLGHRLGDWFPDGRLYTSLDGPDAVLSVHAALADLLEATGHERSTLPSRVDDRARRFKEWTAGRKVLIIADNVATVEQITPLLPADNGSAMVVVGYRRLYGAQLTGRVDLRPIERRHSLELLRAACGGEQPLGDESEFQALLDLLGDLPGPLTDAAGLLMRRPHWSAKQLADWLCRDHGPVVPLSQAYPFHPVTWRCEQLTSELRDALTRIAGTTAESITVEGAAVILGRDADGAEELLEELTEFFLLEVEVAAEASSTRPFQYRLPPLVRAALCSGLVRTLAA